jgi:hypothetical protein
MATTAHFIEHLPSRIVAIRTSAVQHTGTNLSHHLANGGDPILIMVSFGIFPECYTAPDTDPVLHVKSFGVFPEAYR